jgi:hypothetical protein
MAPEAVKEFDALDPLVMFDLRGDEIVVLAAAHPREVYRSEA